MPSRDDALLGLLQTDDDDDKPGWQSQIEPPRVPEPKPSRQLTRAEREKIRAEKRKAQRTTFDLPPPVKQQFWQWSIDYGIPQSQLAVVAAWLLKRAIASGHVDLEAIRVRSDSPKFAYNLTLDEFVKEFEGE